MSPVIAEITIVPLGTADTSLSLYVAEVERVLARHPRIKTQLTPMSTIVEGELDDILAAVRDMHEAPFAKGAKRVSTRLAIDDRRDKAATMAGKVQSVQSKL